MFSIGDLVRFHGSNYIWKIIDWRQHERLLALLECVDISTYSGHPLALVDAELLQKA